MHAFISFIVIALLSVNIGYAQGCCSGGAGSSIVGGAATGVLQKYQMEVSLNYQYLQSNKFFSNDSETEPMFDKLSSNYLFFRTDYGVTNKFTLSVAAGYFIDKTLIELGGERIISSGGIGDLILFPRYNVFAKTKDNKRTEINLGLGLKIPMGSHSDSNLVFSNPTIGDVYAYSPPTVQTTTGSYDLMFNMYVYRGYTKRKTRFFINALYIKRGYNSLGQKFGDYAGVGLFAGKTFFGKLGVTLQLRGEWIGETQGEDGVDLLALYNIDQFSTGGQKVFFVPQISYSVQSFNFYATTEIPLYQNLEGTQVGSQYQLTTGVIYSFFIKNPAEDL